MSSEQSAHSLRKVRPTTSGFHISLLPKFTFYGATALHEAIFDMSLQFSRLASRLPTSLTAAASKNNTYLIKGFGAGPIF